MRKEMWRIASALGFVLLAACSSGGNMKVLSSNAAISVPAQPSVRLIVNPVDKDSADILPDVRAAILGQLDATGYYSRVTTGAEPTDLAMTINITKYSKVTVGERILVGMFAGRNRIDVDVKIAQTAGGMTVKQFSAEGNSAAHPLSSESGVSDAVRELAKEVATAATT